MEDTRPKFLESVTEHPDVQRLIKQVVRSDLRIKELQAENERLKPKPLLFGNLFGFKVIINEAVPDNQIWFATQAQINEALEYSRIQLEQALKGQTND